MRQKSRDNREYFIQRNINDFFCDVSISTVGRVIVASPSAKFTKEFTRELLQELRSKAGKKDSSYR